MIDNRNLLLAFGLSILVLFAWTYFVDQPQRDVQREQMERTKAEQTLERPSSPDASDLPEVPSGPPAVEAPGPAAANIGREIERSAALAAAPRLEISTPRLRGSISLRGGRIDDLELVDYNITPDEKSPRIVLLSPTGTADPYYAEFGFVTPRGSGIAVPSQDSQWTILEGGGALTPDNPVSVVWDNGAGLRFVRTYSVDEDYLFTITQKIENSGSAAIELMPYGLISRHNTPPTTGFYILHEGLLGVFDGTLNEVDYDDIRDDGTEQYSSTGGWLGITDKYWLVALLPKQQAPFNARFTYNPVNQRDRYQVDYLESALVVPAGGTVEITNRLFAGAKEVDVIEDYAERYNIELFDRAIDWGWFYFLTKPLFIVIDWFYGLTGNFGIAIILLTLVIKIIFFPLANRSYVAMSKMKKLQPQMEQIRDRFKDDRQKQQQELMELYRREKVNPVAGCLPILIQIPVFFALYKVLFVTIEMRHAPFYGWIQDLAAQDPTSLFNLFGLIPWDPPSFLTIGAWPIIMGVSMFLQMRLNPTPQDPIQQKIFMWMPVFFTFLLASFPAGLVIYWTVNNVLSIAQQAIIMRREGVNVSVTGT